MIIKQSLFLFIYTNFPQQTNWCSEVKKKSTVWYTCACFRFLDKRRFRRWYQRNVVYCRLLQKGCEKLVTGWELLQLLKKLHCFFSTKRLIETKNCFGHLEGMKGRGKSPSAPSPPSSTSVDRLPILLLETCWSSGVFPLP